jgi:hypothetical protein
MQTKIYYAQVIDITKAKSKQLIMITAHILVNSSNSNHAMTVDG